MTILVTFMAPLPLAVGVRNLWLRIGNRKASKANKTPAGYAYVLTDLKRFNRKAKIASQADTNASFAGHPYWFQTAQSRRTGNIPIKGNRNNAIRVSPHLCRAATGRTVLQQDQAMSSGSDALRQTCR